MKKILFVLIFVLFTSFILPDNAQAACPVGVTCNNGCESVGQCVNNRRCELVDGVLYAGPIDCGSAQLGGVRPPGYIAAYNNQAGNNGLLLFLSRLINLFVIICGIWTMFNFLYSGFIFITYGSDSKAMSEVKDKLTMTGIGLAIIASAYLIAGLIGLIFFGDASFILNPKITGATDLQ